MKSMLISIQNHCMLETRPPFGLHLYWKRLLFVSFIIFLQSACHTNFGSRDTSPYPDPESYRSSTTSEEAPNQTWIAHNYPEYMANPQSVEDLHKGYQYLATIEPDVLARPQFDFNVGRWVGVCHRNHPYHHMRCVSIVCDPSSRYYPRFCQKAAPSLPQYVQQPGDRSEVTKAIRWYTFYESKPKRKIKFDSRTGQWLDACDTRHPYYATECHIPQQMKVYATHSRCIRKLKERYEAQQRYDEQQARKPFSFSEFTQQVGAFVFLGWMGLSGLQPLPGSGSDGNRCGSLHHVF